MLQKSLDRVHKIHDSMVLNNFSVNSVCFAETVNKILFNILVLMQCVISFSSSPSISEASNRFNLLRTVRFYQFSIDTEDIDCESIFGARGIPE